MAGASSAPELARQAPRSSPQQSPYTAWKPRTRSPNSRETDCRHALASWSSAMHGGQTARRLEHPQSTPRAWPEIEALAHQAHVSAAWLGEEFKNGKGPAVSAAGLIQRRSRHPPVSGGTKHPNAGQAVRAAGFSRLYAVYKNYLARPKCSHRARLILDVPEQCCGVWLPSPHLDGNGIMLARVDNLLQRDRSVTLYAAAPDVDFRTSMRRERIPGRHDPCSRNSPLHACHAKPPAIGLSLAEIAFTREGRNAREMGVFGWSC